MTKTKSVEKLAEGWGGGGCLKEVCPQDKLCQLLCVEKFPKVG